MPFGPLVLFLSGLVPSPSCHVQSRPALSFSASSPPSCPVAFRPFPSCPIRVIVRPVSSHPVSPHHALFRPLQSRSVTTCSVPPRSIPSPPIRYRPSRFVPSHPVPSRSITSCRHVLRYPIISSSSSFSPARSLHIETRPLVSLIPSILPLTDEYRPVAPHPFPSRLGLYRPLPALSIEPRPVPFH